jgi:hypothetical protein
VQVFLVGGGDRDPLATDEFAATVARAGSFKATELVTAPGADMTQMRGCLAQERDLPERSCRLCARLIFLAETCLPPPGLASGSWRTSRSKVTSESPLVRDRQCSAGQNAWRLDFTGIARLWVLGC